MKWKCGALCRAVEGHSSSWPGKSAKRVFVAGKRAKHVFALDVPAICAFHAAVILRR